MKFRILLLWNQIWSWNSIHARNFRYIQKSPPLEGFFLSALPDNPVLRVFSYLFLTRSFNHLSEMIETGT